MGSYINPHLLNSVGLPHPLWIRDGKHMRGSQQTFGRLGCLPDASAAGAWSVAGVFWVLQSERG